MASDTSDRVDDLDEKHPDEIKREIDQTRASLTEKINMLGDKLSDSVSSATDAVESVRDTVSDTVESMKSAVGDTVDSVKESVGETVENVKEAFDLKKQVERNPWMVFGAAVVTGFVAERLVNRGVRYYRLHRSTKLANLSSTSGAHAFDATDRLNASQRHGETVAPPAPARTREPEKPGVVSEVVQNVVKSVKEVVDFDKIKSAAAATAKDLVTTWAAVNLPPVALQAMNITPSPDNPGVRRNATNGSPAYSADVPPGYGPRA